MKSDQLPLPRDLQVFLQVIREQSFARAADELDQSPAYVSKRIQTLEGILGTKLFHRTTRRVVLTEDGEIAERWARHILDGFEDMADELSEIKQSPRGLLHICSTFGFGRVHVGPALLALSKRYPSLEVRLELFDRTVDLIRDGFDLEIRIGDDLPDEYLCKKLLSNHRILCASPAYLREHGTPRKLSDLSDHQCLVIKERANAFSAWHLSSVGKGTSTARIYGPLSANSGEIVVQWALGGSGIMLRSVWDIVDHLASGDLVQVLPDYFQMANVWAVYPVRTTQSAKLRVCLDFLVDHFNRVEADIRAAWEASTGRSFDEMMAKAQAGPPHA